MEKELRSELILSRLDFERDPAGFNEAAEVDMEALRKRIQAAREILPQVGLSLR